MLVRLSDLWGDTGFSRGGVFEILLEYTVNKSIDDVMHGRAKARIVLQP